MKQQTLLQAITALLFGNKYYANIINTRGTAKCELSSFIFSTKADAIKHRNELQSTRSFLYVETISFRSRREY